LKNALRRVGELELGLSDVPVEKLELMGVWDHFYSNSAGDQDISTHYVNLPHYIAVKSRPLITIDDQHGDFQWFDLSMVSGDQNCHLYVRDYAGWLSPVRC
jgi:colanic acid biosynthesis protein WcaH